MVKENGKEKDPQGPQAISGVSVCKPAALMTPAKTNEEYDTGRLIRTVLIKHYWIHVVHSAAHICDLQSHLFTRNFRT